MRTALVTGLIFLTGTVSVFADNAAGVAAYRRGELATAVREWRAAADAGDPDAQVNLGMLVAIGRGVDRDLPEAMRLYQLSADRGNAQAQFLLGVIYSKGWGVSQNLAQVIGWSQNEDPSGLGAVVENGFGVEQDDQAAVYYFRLAALHGHPAAEYNLGEMLEHGKGVKRDPVEAFRWFTAAAEHGHGGAAAALAQMYAKGDGVGADPEKAMFWLEVATKAREKGIERWRQRVASKLTPEAIARAQNLASAWQPLALK